MKITTKKSMITIVAIVLIVVGVGLLFLSYKGVFNHVDGPSGYMPDDIKASMENNYIKMSYSDFDLVLTGTRELTKEEETRKKGSNDAGIDGGESMIQPSQKFKVFVKDGKLILDSDIEMLPYARTTFSVNGNKFTLFGDMTIQDAEGKEYKEIK